MTILSFVAFAISLIALGITMIQSKKLIETRVRLHIKEKDLSEERQKNYTLQMSSWTKDLTIEELQKRLEVTDCDERRDGENPCRGKCVLSVFLPRDERRREKGNHRLVVKAIRRL